MRAKNSPKISSSSPPAPSTTICGSGLPAASATSAETSTIPPPTRSLKTCSAKSTRNTIPTATFSDRNDRVWWEWFPRRVSYISGDFDDPATYEKLKDLLGKVDQEHNSHGNVF